MGRWHCNRRFRIIANQTRLMSPNNSGRITGLFYAALDTQYQINAEGRGPAPIRLIAGARFSRPVAAPMQLLYLP